MNLAAPGGVRLEHQQQHIAHTVRLTIPNDIVRVIQTQTPDAIILTLSESGNEAILELRVEGRSPQRYPIQTTPELKALLQLNPTVNLNVRVASDGGIMLIGQVARPEPIHIIIRGEGAKAAMPAPQIDGRPQSELPKPLQAVTHMTAEKAVNLLSSKPSVSIQPAAIHPLVSSDDKVPVELARSVVQSIQTVGGERTMLIPDVSPAIPRPIAPDALPTNVPIRQPIASELGLKAGQVVQALVASSGDKMALQLGSHQLPLPQQMKLAAGEIAMRVIQTKEGLGLIPLNTQAAQVSQAAGLSGVSAALASVLSRSGQKPQVNSLFSPGALESVLQSAGLAKEAAEINGQRLNSKQLTGELIAQAVRYGGLAQEKSLLEGVAMQGGMLKPWLRQLLRLLPQQSELSSRITGLVSELESLQLEALPSAGGRESGLMALLLFKDQPPVELLFERQQVAEDGEVRHLWILNVHTSLEHLGEVWLKSAFRGKEIDLTFWAIQSDTAELAKKSKLDLEEALSEHGLSVRSMNFYNTARPGSGELGHVNLPHMDVKA